MYRRLDAIALDVGSVDVTGGTLTVASGSCDTFSVASPGVLDFADDYTVGAGFSGTGTLQASGGIVVVLCNLDVASVNITAGRLIVSGGGGTCNDFSIAAGGILEFADDYVISGGGASLVGDGNLEVTGGTVSIGCSLDLDSASSLTIGHATVSLGGGGSCQDFVFLYTDSDLVFTSSYSLTSGSNVAGDGSFIVNSGTVQSEGAFDVGSTQVNGGTLLFNGSSVVQRTTSGSFSSGLLGGTGAFEAPSAARLPLRPMRT